MSSYGPRCRFLDDEYARLIPQAKALGGLLKSVMAESAPTVRRDLGDGASDQVVRLNKIWAKAVGDPIESFTEVVFYRSGVLHVAVASPALVLDLEFSKESLVSGVAKCGLQELHDLKFKVDSKRFR